MYIDDIYVYSMVLGVEEHEIQNSMAIYPNPTSESCYVTFSVNQKQDVKIDFVNIQGQLMMSRTINTVGSEIEYFDLSPALASFVAITEVSVGVALIIGGFLKNPYGNFITRIAGFTIVILMVNIFVIAHPDWFINTKLFTSVQIFLFIGGLYFLIKGNRS